LWDGRDSIRGDLDIGACAGYLRTTKPLFISGDLTIDNPDSTVFLDTVSIGGASSVFAVPAKIKFGPACVLVFNGIGQQKLYVNGHSLPKVVVRKGSKLTIKA
jgi:hypothetical protein